MSTKEKPTTANTVTLTLEEYMSMTNESKRLVEKIKQQEEILTDNRKKLRKEIEDAIKAVHGDYNWESNLWFATIQYSPRPNIKKQIKKLSFWEKLKLLFS